MSAPDWTPERVEKLKALVADNLSASQIADELGGVTRNAVIGKVARLGLTLGAGQRTPIKRRPKRQAPAYRSNVVALPARPARPTPRKAAVPPPPRPQIDKPTVAAMPLMLPLESLTERTCKWPFGDQPPYTFCGAPSLDGKPYCPKHCAAAYSSGTQRDFDRMAARALGGSLHLGRAGVAA